MIKIATFNLENLFTRPTAMLEDDAIGRKAIEDHATANAIVRKVAYTQADKNKLITLSNKYGWHLLNPPKNSLVFLQKVRGRLFKKPKNGPLEVDADGRADWTGWFELRRDNILWRATFNTGRVIAETQADILITIEAESRPTLKRFNEQVLEAEFQFQYAHFMVIDGNDDRGIDVGIMSRFPIVEMRSHVSDLNSNGDPVFSRDCPEYDVLLPGNKRLAILPNHLKSKRNGDDEASQKRRRLQAETAHTIAKNAQQRTPFVIVAGDLNDTPDSSPLSSLFTEGFRDVIEHTDYPKTRPGTYLTGLKSQKIDYLILSQALWPKLNTAGIERRGSYHPNLWDAFDTVTKSVEAASDHHLVWAELDL